MHMYKAANHFYGGCGIVGAQTALGAGLGFAHKYRKDGSIAMTLCVAGVGGLGSLSSYKQFQFVALLLYIIGQ